MDGVNGWWIVNLKTLNQHGNGGRRLLAPCSAAWGFCYAGVACRVVLYLLRGTATAVRCLPLCRSLAVAGAPKVKPANWVKVDWGTVKWLPFLENMFW